MYEEPNTCVTFSFGVLENQRSVFLILNGTQYEYLTEMIIDLSQIVFIYLYYEKKEEILPLDNTYIQALTNNFKDLLCSVALDIEVQDGIPPAISVLFSVQLFWNDSCVIFVLVINLNVRLVPTTCRSYSLVTTHRQR
jgi:hypothetical protein